MSPEPSILFPTQQKVVDRKYYEAGVRGRFEKNLRVERGRINTTTPTILEGVGFTIVKNAVGLVTVTFDPPFSANPTILLTNEASPGSVPLLYIVSGTLTASSFQAFRDNQDGVFTFAAMGPS
jgi:hypothetical protein